MIESCVRCFLIDIYGGLCPYCVLFLIEECHLNE